MKIYNKKKFTSGMFMLLLGLIVIALEISDLNFRNLELLDIKHLIVNVLLLLFGFTYIKRSLSIENSKEDKLEELDERNILLNLKIETKTFQVIKYFGFMLMLLFFVVGSFFEAETIIAMGLGIAFLYPVYFIVTIIISLYYERKI